MALGPTIAESIRSARLARDLQESDCAAEVGLSLAQYQAVEADPRALVDRVSLGTARRLCRLLHLDLLELSARQLGISVGAREPTGNAQFYARHILIEETRRQRGMTPRMLGDRLGFEPALVHELEATPDYIETLPVRIVVDISVALNLDPGLLIANRNLTP